MRKQLRQIWDNDDAFFIALMFFMLGVVVGFCLGLLF